MSLAAARGRWWKPSKTMTKAEAPKLSNISYTRATFDSPRAQIPATAMHEPINDVIVWFQLEI